MPLVLYSLFSYGYNYLVYFLIIFSIVLAILELFINYDQ